MCFLEPWCSESGVSQGVLAGRGLFGKGGCPSLQSPSPSCCEHLGRAGVSRAVYSEQTAFGHPVPFFPLGKRGVYGVRCV